MDFRAIFTLVIWAAINVAGTYILGKYLLEGDYLGAGLAVVVVNVFLIILGAAAEYDSEYY